MKKILMDTFMEKVKKIGYTVKEFSADRKVYEVSKDGKSFLTLGKYFPLNSITANGIAKRKNLTKQILSAGGVPTPKGILTGEWKIIEGLLKNGSLKFPLVVKPDTSSLGKMVTAKIKDIESLKKAFELVKKEYETVLIEEYVEGEDFRFLVLDGRVLTVAKRVLPFVIGDGISNISELIPGKIKVKREVKRCLSDQGLDINSIPVKNRKVILRMNANVHTGASVENVSETADPFFKDLAIKAAAMLKIRFAGVDIIAKDITDKNSAFTVTEVNSSPSYDIHFLPKVGKPYDPTKEILDSILQ
jgi:cyanophycin synthetase